MVDDYQDDQFINIPMYRPTIYIQNDRKNCYAPIAEVSRCWASNTPPKFTHDLQENPDAAFLKAATVEELFALLPTLLQLHSEKIPILLLCDHQGHLAELTAELNISFASTSIDSATASGILYGILQRQDELSILRSKVGLMSTLRTTLQDDIDQLNSDLSSAATLQKEFMSSDGEPVHGIYFNTLWRPTGVVSGDMYDITKLDDDHISFFIADAIGHGMQGAMLAMAITKALEGCRTDHNGNYKEPSVVLDILNKSILDRNGSTARFATAMYGVINCKRRTMTIAGAGHPPALWINGTNTPKLLESKGPLLGIFSDADFPQSTIKLESNDRVILYSDGFEDVLELRSKNTDLPPYLQVMFDIGCEHDNIVDGISTILDRQNEHHDDLTMLCLHVGTLVSKRAA